MKERIISLFISIVLIFGMTACGGIQESGNSATSSAAVEQKTYLTEADETETGAQSIESEEEESSWEWSKDSLENQGIDSGKIEEVHTVYDSFQLLTAVIVRNGYIVDEYYKDGYDENSTFILNSASKSITSALIGIAIEEGYIESVDTALSEYFPEILEYEDDYWADITIENLLTHTSGITSTDDYLWESWRSSENWVEYILSLPIVSVPGSTFSYSTGNTHLLAAILEQATGMSLYDFGKLYLFDPLGMDSVQVDTDPQGVSDGGNGIWMNPYDMAKFGQLYLNGGTWEGEQIVPAEWVEASTSLQFQRSSGTADYGYHWWVRTFGDENYTTYFAQGHDGQYIFVVPQLDLVITFTSDYAGSTQIYWQLVNDIVNSCTE